MADEMLKEILARNEKLVKPAGRPGYRTTEFWLSCVVVIVSVLAGQGLGGTWGSIITVVGSILTGLGYAVTRSSVKKGLVELAVIISGLLGDKK